MPPPLSLGDGHFCRPFLKWPGGKYRFLRYLTPHFNQAAHTLVEPFVGAGAVFLNSRLPNLIINDLNKDLINLYKQIIKHKYLFIEEAKKLFIGQHNHPAVYYELRKQFNESHTNEERALLFLFLNRFGYNGLCRFNQKGGYNVPFGAYLKPYFPEKELIHFINLNLNLKINCLSYDKFLLSFLKRENLKDMIFYCDPPYVPLTKTANFTQYQSKAFTLSDQNILLSIAEQLKNKGALVIISNHDTPLTRQMYQGATKLLNYEIRRTISCQVTQRHKAKELLVIL